MSDTVEVRFTQRDAPWNEGAVEAFAPEVAEKLVRNGVAKYVDTPTKKKGKKGEER